MLYETKKHIRIFLIQNYASYYKFILHLKQHLKLETTQIFSNVCHIFLCAAWLHEL